MFYFSNKLHKMCYITMKLHKKRVTLEINNIKICNITNELHKNVLNYK